MLFAKKAYPIFLPHPQGGTTVPRKEPQKTGRVLMLPLDSIEPSPYQARTAFDEQEIAALAVSILQNGLLQPVSVRRTGLHKYQLVAGERRLRACRLAKLEKIPAILADYDDSESAALGLLENLQRSQLDPFDTARGIKEVIRLWGCTQAEAARRLGLSQPALANKLRLLTLTPAQQQLCAAHHLSERHARAVLRLPDNLAPYVAAGDELAAFIGDECRGVGQQVDGLWYVMLKGTPDEQGMVSIRYYSAANRYLYRTAEGFEFESDGVYGTADNPVTLSLVTQE